MAQKMTKEEYNAFLSEGARTGKLATVGPDGQPHVVPIWYVLDGDAIIFMTGESTAKAKHMRREPRVALCVDDESPPYAFVMVQGTVQYSPNPPEMLDWSTRIAARYMGAVLAESYGKRNAVDGELLVRLTPTRVIASKGVAD